MNLPDAKKIVKFGTYFSIAYLFIFSIAMALFPIRPFWNDEWRLIYNLKFKTVPYLWGSLDLLQQFPRVYLIILKCITEYFDYSYVSLRLPSLIVGFFAVCLCFWIHKKLYKDKTIHSYLFILILVSSQTFTDYLVQTKQYEMEILMSLVALAQLIYLLEISNKGILNKKYYVLFCLISMVVPFFSYTYPIAFAPVFIVLFFKLVLLLRTSSTKSGKLKFALIALFPLLLSFISILVFYIIDVKQVMTDVPMHTYWASNMMTQHAAILVYLENIWLFFATVGSGLLYASIFGLLGLIAFVYGMHKLFGNLKHLQSTNENWLSLYAILVIIIAIFLYLLGKLPLGVARMNAFAIPSIVILILLFFDFLGNNVKTLKLNQLLTVILFIGLVGNIITTCINVFICQEYQHKMDIYIHSSEAIKTAKKMGIPIIVTTEAYGEFVDLTARVPNKLSGGALYQQHSISESDMTPAYILEVLPQYHLKDSIRIYNIPEMKHLSTYLNQLPPETKTVMVGNGIKFDILNIDNN